MTVRSEIGSVAVPFGPKKPMTDASGVTNRYVWTMLTPIESGGLPTVPLVLRPQAFQFDVVGPKSSGLPSTTGPLPGL